MGLGEVEVVLLAHESLSSVAGPTPLNDDSLLGAGVRVRVRVRLELGFRVRAGMLRIRETGGQTL